MPLGGSVYLSIFRERGRGGEGGRQTSICERYTDLLPLAQPHLGTWPAIQTCALTGNWTNDLLVQRLVLNPLSHTSQGATGILERRMGQMITVFIRKINTGATSGQLSSCLWVFTICFVLNSVEGTEKIQQTPYFWGIYISLSEWCPDKAMQLIFGPSLLSAHLRYQ